MYQYLGQYGTGSVEREQRRKLHFGMVPVSSTFSFVVEDMDGRVFGFGVAACLVRQTNRKHVVPVSIHG